VLCTSAASNGGRAFVPAQNGTDSCVLVILSSALRAPPVPRQRQQEWWSTGSRTPNILFLGVRCLFARACVGELSHGRDEVRVEPVGVDHPSEQEACFLRTTSARTPEGRCTGHPRLPATVRKDCNRQSPVERTCEQRPRHL
jgi:hypothetical protein